MMRPAEVELFHADTQMDKAKPNAAFRNSANAAYKWKSSLQVAYCKGKGKAIPLQARKDPEASRKLRFTDFVTTAQDGVKVVSLTHRSPLPPGNAPGTHFC